MKQILLMMVGSNVLNSTHMMVGLTYLLLIIMETKICQLKGGGKMVTQHSFYFNADSIEVIIQLDIATASGACISVKFKDITLQNHIGNGSDRSQKYDYKWVWYTNAVY